jgi:hypothetical protein
VTMGHPSLEVTANSHSFNLDDAAIVRGRPRGQSVPTVPQLANGDANEVVGSNKLRRPFGASSSSGTDDAGTIHNNTENRTAVGGRRRQKTNSHKPSRAVDGERRDRTTEASEFDVSRRQSGSDALSDEGSGSGSASSLIIDSRTLHRLEKERLFRLSFMDIAEVK